MMKRITLLTCVVAMTGAAYADNCEAIKAQIAEKIKANGVKAFTLEAVEKGTITDKKIVGVCGGGTKDILYQRGTNNSITDQNSPSASAESSL